MPNSARLWLIPSSSSRSLFLLQLLLPLLLLQASAAAGGTVQVNCFPEQQQSHDPGRTACASRGCQYVGRNGDAPICQWQHQVYSLTAARAAAAATVASASWQLNRRQGVGGPFPNSSDVDQLQLVVTEVSDHAARIQLTDPNNNRYTVPKAALDIPEPGPTDANNKLYTWAVNSSQQHNFVQLYHRQQQHSTAVLAVQSAGLIYSDQFIQIPLSLGCSRIYGLGEHSHEQLLHNRNYKRWTIWTRDMSPLGPHNLYSAHPYFICGQDDKYIGVLMKASNAMEVELTPDGVIFRLLGGVPDLYVFFGDSPEAVTRHYSSAIGHPLMPPYWSLGFQLCRWGYENISVVRNVINRNRAIGLPYDVQYGDIDYMQNTMDFTIDQTNYPGLSEMVDDLHEFGQRYFVILDPAISSDRDLHQRVLPSRRYEPYEDGLVRGVFTKNPDGSLHEGEVWPGRTVFPDFSHPSTLHWWEHWVRDFYYNQSIRVDGLWIDMNEPASFTYEPHKPNTCPMNKWNYPPYLPTSFLGRTIYEKTICMEAQHNWGSHYDTHSLYGHAMAEHSYKTLLNMFPTKRPIVFGRSTFAGTGRYAQHWLGDNFSRWPDMHWSIVAMLEFGLFGFPYTGADICGFIFDAERQMCIRWQQLGAFYPFSRNHNVKIADGRKTRDQDPGSWDTEAQSIMKTALLFRYTYLPYLYTLFHYAHTEGATVVRSLNHEFPLDRNTAAIDRQFMWGSAMLITPVLDPDVSHVSGYFPTGGWYDAWNGTELKQSGNVTLDAPLEKINIHFRKGHILPWQEPSVNTVRSRKKPLGLVVALQRIGGMQQPARFQAKGSLFWDDGESFETFKNGQYIMHQFEFSSNQAGTQHTLEITAQHGNYKDPNNLKFQSINIFGFDTDFSVATHEILVNDHHEVGIMFDRAQSQLQLHHLALGLGHRHRIVIQAKAGAALMCSSAAALLVIALASFLTKLIN